jgi:hypothetical protein
VKPPSQPEQQRRGTGTLNHQETLPFPIALSISTVRQTGATSLNETLRATLTWVVQQVQDCEKDANHVLARLRLA